MRPLIGLTYFKSIFPVQSAGSDAALNELFQVSTDFLEERTGNRILLNSDGTSADRLTEYFHGDGETIIYNLRAFPVVSVESVRVNSDRDFSDSSDDISSDYYGVDKENGQIIFESAPASGIRNVRVIYSGGYNKYNIPHRLRLACAMLTQFFRKRDFLAIPQEGEGRTPYESFPKIVNTTIKRFTRKRFGLYGEYEA